MLRAGTDSVLRAMEVYTKQAWVLRAWQDVFVDLVQGQLQHLFLSLLSRAPKIAALNSSCMTLCSDSAACTSAQDCAGDCVPCHLTLACLVLACHPHVRYRDVFDLRKQYKVWKGIM
jgi:hypothetical protein